MDLDTLKSAIIYPFVEAKLLTLDQVGQQFGPLTAKLLQGVISYNFV